MRVPRVGRVALGWLILASPGWAQSQRSEEQTVPPPPEAAGGATAGVAKEMGLPSAPAPGPTEAQVRGRFRPPAGTGRDASRVAQARLLSMAEGSARLRFADGEEVVRAGSRVGGDVVRSVGAGQIVLDRPPAEGHKGGAGVVMVTFGADGRARVLVVWERDPAAVVPVEVR